ncbi:hypothetical protein TheveDRAFT_0462 [Thermanaerovibrio velox DSM 12556]|uniref:DUF501 domain-containing protein n=1 Tax=Thermanaerovibrio velox DSM 12556 TaxID=926567 RepID=H0UPZ7_9BACT|nr:DUF501 domain-containing protein [Thermanaerovibrio velox]EHM09626.1 hypothetical protein TheveDRAFT_0462 [Thermanaerovibrio velox DSM 12556]
MTLRVLVPGGGCPPVFYVPRDHLRVPWDYPARIRDRSVVRGFCALCSWGFPRVLLCGPVSKRGPFPTTFWLVCPYLMDRCSHLESSGGVARLEARMERDMEAMRDYHRMHRMVRRALLTPAEWSMIRARAELAYPILGKGMGGTDFSGVFGAKCLHLQVGSFLGLGYHPFGSHLSLEVGDMCCPDGRCGLSRGAMERG